MSEKKQINKIFAAAAMCVTILSLVFGNNAVAQTNKADGSSNQARSRLGRTLFDIFFQTPQRGWAVGQDGIVFFTTNGGKNWLERKVGDETLRQIVFADSTDGWLLTDTRLLRTNDGGSAWKPFEPPNHRVLSRIYFVNPQIGWILGKDGSIFKTADSGNTWQRQASGTREQLNDIACFSASSCIVGGKKKILLTTLNGGRTWIKRPLPISAYYELRRVRVTHDGTALALASAYRVGHVLGSSDRGRRWEVLTGGSMLENPASLYFFNRNRGLVLDVSILLTEDGGATLDSVWPGGAVPLSIFFIDEKLGWTAGDFQTILHTEDGGRTWVKQHDDGQIPIPHER